MDIIKDLYPHDGLCWNDWLWTRSALFLVNLPSAIQWQVPTEGIFVKIRIIGIYGIRNGQGMKLQSVVLFWFSQGVLGQAFLVITLEPDEINGSKFNTRWGSSMG